MAFTVIDVLKQILKDNQEYHRASIAEQREQSRLLRKLAGEPEMSPKQRRF